MKMDGTIGGREQGKDISKEGQERGRKIKLDYVTHGLGQQENFLMNFLGYAEYEARELNNPQIKISPVNLCEFLSKINGKIKNLDNTHYLKSDIKDLLDGLNFIMSKIKEPAIKTPLMPVYNSLEKTYKYREGGSINNSKKEWGEFISLYNRTAVKKNLELVANHINDLPFDQKELIKEDFQKYKKFKVNLSDKSEDAAQTLLQQNPGLRDFINEKYPKEPYALIH